MKRSFEEFQAEVYKRRDEKVRKQRRIRKTVLTLALPLILIAGILPWMIPVAEKAGGVDLMAENFAEESENMKDVSLTMTITKGEELYPPKDEESFQAIYRILSDHDFLADEATDDGSSVGGSVHLQSTTAPAGEVDAVVTLTDEDGDEMHFRFWRETGYLASEEKVRKLSEEDAKLLWSLIEGSDTE